MERERQLSEEQMTVQTLQNKLKEIRQEFSTEKTKFAQIRRQLEDASNQKLQDVQQLQARLQQLRQEAIAEKQTAQQKLQQVKACKDELVANTFCTGFNTNVSTDPADANKLDPTEGRKRCCKECIEYGTGNPRQGGKFRERS